MIRTESLRKVYPKDVVALESLDFEVREGELFGLLGPNGAGKTTTIGILTTRVLPTSGTATIDGGDVVRDAARVRATIGVVPQRPNPDRGLTAIENLVFHAAYFGVRRARRSSKSCSTATPRRSSRRRKRSPA